MRDLPAVGSGQQKMALPLVGRSHQPLGRFAPRTGAGELHRPSAPMIAMRPRHANCSTGYLCRYGAPITRRKDRDGRPEGGCAGRHSGSPEAIRVTTPGRCAWHTPSPCWPAAGVLLRALRARTDGSPPHGPPKALVQREATLIAHGQRHHLPVIRPGDGPHGPTGRRRRRAGWGSLAAAAPDEAQAEQRRAVPVSRDRPMTHSLPLVVLRPRSDRAQSWPSPIPQWPDPRLSTLPPPCHSASDRGGLH